MSYMAKFSGSELYVGSGSTADSQLGLKISVRPFQLCTHRENSKASNRTTQPKSSRCRDYHTAMEPPDWYYRVSLACDLEDREVRGSDFDEDISELREGEGDSEGSGSDAACEGDGEDGCECGSEDECECDSREDDDEESELSYTGSDAYNYYDLKRQRIARKIHLRDEKEQVPENPIVYPAYEAILKAQNERGCPENEDRAEEARGEQEVYAAYEAMLEAQERGHCPKLKPIFNQMFTLYSVDFHDYCSHEWFFRTPYVEFSALCRRTGTGTMIY